MLSEGTSDLITGGVFVANGADVKSLRNSGVVTTYGVNDMALDAWGSVDDWIVEKPVTTHGPSGIGFVNFGTVGHFEAREKIETFGPGARGFNQYDGTIHHAVFKSIVTHGHGSVGIQVSKPVGTLEIQESVRTNGSIGETLVKGKITRLAANAISVTEGGEVENLVLGSALTHGENVRTLEVKGKIKQFVVRGDISAFGDNSIGVWIGENGQAPADIRLRAGGK
jgi:hypothetical protein